MATPDAGLARCVDGLQQVLERRLAGTVVRAGCAKRSERLVDRLINPMPFRGVARLERGLGLVPRRFEILDASLCDGQVALVDERLDIDRNLPESREITELRCGIGRRCKRKAVEG